MAASPVPGGLMLHQKDEHDIWVCKSCGWKYPNAKPSAKIRKHHKRQCPGTGGPDPHHHEEISDEEASDDEHHHGTLHGLHHGPHSASHSGPHRGAHPEPDHGHHHRPFHGSHHGDLQDHSGDHHIAASSPRDLQIDEHKSLQSNGAGQGNRSGANQGLAKQEGPGPKFDDNAHGASTSAGHLAPLMDHQKDEHDIWICKDCGWKYPNAKPSPKVKRHHRKQCPGHKEAGVRSTEGISSDEHEHSGDDNLPEMSLRVEEAPPEILKKSRKPRRSVTFEDEVTSGTSGAAGGVAKESEQNLVESGRPEIPSRVDSGGQDISKREESEFQESREFTSASGEHVQDPPTAAPTSTVRVIENQEGSEEEAMENRESHDGKQIRSRIRPKDRHAMREWESGRKGALGMKLTQEKRRARWPNGEKWSFVRSF